MRAIWKSFVFLCRGLVIGLMWSKMACTQRRQRNTKSADLGANTTNVRLEETHKRPEPHSDTLMSVECW